MVVNYVFEASLSGSKGIFDKNLRNAKALVQQANGGKIIAIFNHDLNKDDQLRLESMGVQYHVIPKWNKLHWLCNRSILWRLLPYIKRIARARIFRLILKNITNGVTYVRYSNSDRFILNSFKKLQTPLFIELNGLVFEELKTGYGNDKSYFGKYNVRNEIKYLPKLLSIANGVTCITNEIAKFAKQYNQHTLVIGNSSEQLIVDNSNAGKSPIKFLFLVGADTYWQGINRLANSVNKLSVNDQQRIKISIVGPKKLQQKYANQFKGDVNFVKAQTNQELEKLLINHHIGLTTLSLYKKKMEEAAPLKTRDYLRAGMPIVLAYKDADIEQMDGIKDFVFKVTNNDEPLPMNDIILWAENMDYKKAKKCILQQVRAQLLVEVKAKKINRFMIEHAG